MKPLLELRITVLIRQKTSGPERIALHRLVKEINAKARESKLEGSVDFRMLNRIRDGRPNFKVSNRTMQLLANYFPELKLQPAFVVPGVVDGLVGRSRLVFLLAAKPRPAERRNDISHWDSLALTELFAHCSKRSSHHNFSIEHVLWRKRAQPDALHHEAWFNALASDDNSVVSIGSPIVSLSSEWMLAQMLDVPAFVPPDEAVLRRMPFAFAWRPKTVAGFSSAFHIPLPVLKKMDAEAAAEVGANAAAAFLLDRKIHRVPLAAQDNGWTMHGVIAAQRRAAGNVWLVVSGLGGPATLAATRQVQHIVQELPWNQGQDSPVLWVPVKAKIAAGKGAPGGGDDRKVVSASFDGKPRLWSLKNA